MKIEHLTLAAGRHMKVNGANHTFCDARMADMEFDEGKRCIIVWPKNSSGNRVGKTIWVPLESVAFAVPAQTEQSDAAIARRRARKEGEAAARGDSE